ncbi:hypothetical protein KDW_25040 [Dictyobacter vulcani]|uniref:Uncharacterized protein n=1 Tax=Dictyobacter vulcani TaxID=2607529 RepID=A0A5J4KMG5_9CHLR|nr:hypothetical protein KDW_25040 [Dictyobacter vulcani]
MIAPVHPAVATTVATVNPARCIPRSAQVVVMRLRFLSSPVKIARFIVAIATSLAPQAAVVIADRAGKL